LPAVGPAVARLICTATPCTDDQTFGPASSPAEVHDPGTAAANDSQTTTVTFSQFDPSLGTLTEIDITLDSTPSCFLSVSGHTKDEEAAAFAGETTSWDVSFSLTIPVCHFRHRVR